MNLYVEGGGDAKALRTACRAGFAEFLRRAGLAGRMPRIVACGGRSDAYHAFCIALKNDEPAMLLVDSEGPVSSDVQRGEVGEWLPWLHLAQRIGDEWRVPAGAAQRDCHLMVQCMESWFLADRSTLGAFFAQGFQENHLPSLGNPIEPIPKSVVYESLDKATQHCKTKARYGKGEHSFKLLGLINPARITDESPWAARFVNELKLRMGAR